MLQVRSFSNVGPILLSRIVIDLDGNIARVQAVLPIASRPGNPVFLPRTRVDVIRLKTTNRTELLATIGDRAACLRIRDAANSGRAIETIGLRFDVHNSRLMSHCDPGRRPSGRPSAPKKKGQGYRVRPRPPASGVVPRSSEGAGGPPSGLSLVFYGLSVSSKRLPNVPQCAYNAHHKRNGPSQRS